MFVIVVQKSLKTLRGGHLMYAFAAIPTYLLDLLNSQYMFPSINWFLFII